MFAMRKLISLSRAYNSLVRLETVQAFHAVSTEASKLNRTVVKFDRFCSSDSECLTLAYQMYAEPAISENTVPIIILHGLLGSKNNWNSMSKAILMGSNFRKVFAVDARNHGESPHVDEFSYEMMVGDILKLMSDKDMKKASFIGHSMGGRVCMLLAQMFPERVQSMVIVDISPVSHSPSMVTLPNLFRIIMNLCLDRDLPLAEARKQATAELKKNKLDDKLISFVLTNLVENEGKTNWRWKFNLVSISKHFEKEICRLPLLRYNTKTRTLFVSGMESDYLRPEQEPTIKKLFPAAEFVYIEGAGHWVHAEKPHEFLEVVTRFFRNE